MIGGSLAGGIGRVRCVRRDFGKCSRIAQRAEYLVGGNMEKTDIPLSTRFKLSPVAQSLLQERVRTDNVGADELAWAVNLFFHNTSTTEIYTLSLHDALPIS